MERVRRLDGVQVARMTAGVPVVPVCRTGFAADRRAVEVNSMVLDAGSYILEYDFDA
ncbi:UTRA domain-containing protein [Embleya sp. NPDC001921]